MSADALAHTRLSKDGVNMLGHGLSEHLVSVGELAATFAAGFSPDWARLAGLWHDLGKYRPGFQAYIRQTSGAHLEGRLPSASDKTHSAAGALHAIRTFGGRWGGQADQAARPLAYVIAGHHAGLSDWHPSDASAGLSARLFGSGGAPAQREYEEALAACAAVDAGLLALPSSFDLRSSLIAIPGLVPRSQGGERNPLAAAVWIRMLFSALVDADFLDTEAFMDGSRSAQRTGWMPLERYRDLLDQHLTIMAGRTAAAGRAADPIMTARAEVLAACLAKSHLGPGVFALTVPTGGGKTLSSLAFALHHAVRHRKRRVIYAIPYTSIIEQTAEVFSGIFGRDAVLEHHSQADEDSRSETARSRLACENWDAPLIVTTNVQLFESLFASRTSRCRKLHRLADAVIVLDEAHLLPSQFLQPILDVLRLLVGHYGVSLVLCSATQPVLTDVARFDPRRSVRGLPAATQIVDDPERLFARLRRTQVEWPVNLDVDLGLEPVADGMAAEECVLGIGNTRRDAVDLLSLVDARCSEPALHLSAAMCGQHRADVIAVIRSRLEARTSGRDSRPLRVVSTQLVEAGVDIDFPVVFRSLSGLDSIVQAAGRCNREGRAPAGGRVVVFVREIPRPLATLRHGVDASRSALAAEPELPVDPSRTDLMTRYFGLYHGSFESLDRHGIVDLLSSDIATLEFAFRTAAERFRLVDDVAHATVLVPYRGAAADVSGLEEALGLLRAGLADRWLLRRIQRYLVPVRSRVVEDWRAQGSVAEVIPGLFLLEDPLLYDGRLGLRSQGAPLDPLNLVS